MARGRPLKSIVRDRLSQLLFVFGSLTAYDAHKHYIVLFAKTSQRNVYYQLRRGVDLELFNAKTVIEQGEFSWGSTSRKVYFSLSSKSIVPSVDKRIVTYKKNLDANKLKN